MTPDELMILPDSIKDAIFESWIQMEVTSEQDYLHFIHAQTCSDCMLDYQNRFTTFLKRNINVQDIVQRMTN